MYVIIYLYNYIWLFKSLQSKRGTPNSLILEHVSRRCPGHDLKGILQRAIKVVSIINANFYADLKISYRL